MAGIKSLPCMKCKKETRSHQIFPGLNLCHNCWYEMTPDMAVTMSKKASRIAYHWVHEKLIFEMRERDIFVKKRMMLGRKSSVHMEGAKKPKEKPFKGRKVA